MDTAGYYYYVFTVGVPMIACLPKDTYTLLLTTHIISSIHPRGHTLKILKELGGTFGVVFQDLDHSKITWLHIWLNFCSSANFQIIGNVCMLSLLLLGNLILLFLSVPLNLLNCDTVQQIMFNIEQQEYYTSFVFVFFVSFCICFCVCFWWLAYFGASCA